MIPSGGFVAAILIVEDEPLVAQMIRRTLEDRHTVAVEGSAQSAVALYDSGRRFDLVITDLAMPDRDGIWLSNELVRRDPALARRMIFLTGGATTSSARLFLQGPGVEWLQKPFQSAELHQRIERLLG
jgi:CheY-like chemotaxis protein